MDPSRVRRFAWAVVPVALYMAAIFLISAQSDLPRTRLDDKLLHAGEYAVLGLLVCRALIVLGRAPSLATVALAAAITTAFGVTDEVHQMYVPRREASLEDLVADAVGGLAGAAVLAAWASARRRRNS